jgi:hypothetical protein
MGETMPNNTTQDKKTIPEKRIKPAARPLRAELRGAPQSLERIMKDRGWIPALKRMRELQQEWLVWLDTALPEELRGSIVNVVRKGNELTVLAASAAWSARLRYALAALAPQLHERAPDIVKVQVRVAPSGGKSP